MSDTKNTDAGKGRLSLRPAGRLELGRTVDAGSVRQSFSHCRSKVVQVEVRKNRGPGAAPRPGTHLMPGMYELNEQVVCRRRAAGGIPWNWNVGILSPPLPAGAPECR